MPTVFTSKNGKYNVNVDMKGPVRNPTVGASIVFRPNVFN